MSGEADDGADRFGNLQAWIRKLVPELGAEANRWSGQVMTTLDYCGHIGRDPDDERVFVATGDSGQGITQGALAGLLIRDLIVRDRARGKTSTSRRARPRRRLVLTSART
jgi:glycine/D-amino acid oxidase-like deaminating enzyme